MASTIAEILDSEFNGIVRLAKAKVLRDELRLVKRRNIEALVTRLSSLPVHDKQLALVVVLVALVRGTELVALLRERIFSGLEREVMALSDITAHRLKATLHVHVAVEVLFAVGNR